MALDQTMNTTLMLDRIVPQTIRCFDDDQYLETAQEFIKKVLETANTETALTAIIVGTNFLENVRVHVKNVAATKTNFAALFSHAFKICDSQFAGFTRTRLDKFFFDLIKVLDADYANLTIDTTDADSIQTSTDAILAAKKIYAAPIVKFFLEIRKNYNKYTSSSFSCVFPKGDIKNGTHSEIVTECLAELFGLILYHLCETDVSPYKAPIQFIVGPSLVSSEASVIQNISTDHAQTLALLLPKNNETNINLRNRHSVACVLAIEGLQQTVKAKAETATGFTGSDYESRSFSHEGLARDLSDLVKRLFSQEVNTDDVQMIQSYRDRLNEQRKDFFALDTTNHNETIFCSASYELLFKEVSKKALEATQLAPAQQQSINFVPDCSFGISPKINDVFPFVESFGLSVPFINSDKTNFTANPPKWDKKKSFAKFFFEELQIYCLKNRVTRLDDHFKMIFYSLDIHTARQFQQSFLSKYPMVFDLSQDDLHDLVVQFCGRFDQLNTKSRAEHQQDWINGSLRQKEHESLTDYYQRNVVAYNNLYPTKNATTMQQLNTVFLDYIRSDYVRENLKKSASYFSLRRGGDPAKSFEAAYAHEQSEILQKQENARAQSQLLSGNKTSSDPLNPLYIEDITKRVISQLGNSKSSKKKRAKLPAKVVEEFKKLSKGKNLNSDGTYKVSIDRIPDFVKKSTLWSGVENFCDKEETKRLLNIAKTRHNFFDTKKKPTKKTKSVKKSETVDKKGDSSNSVRSVDDVSIVDEADDAEFSNKATAGSSVSNQNVDDHDFFSEYLSVSKDKSREVVSKNRYKNKNTYQNKVAANNIPVSAGSFDDYESAEVKGIDDVSITENVCSSSSNEVREINDISIIENIDSSSSAEVREIDDIATTVENLRLNRGDAKIGEAEVKFHFDSCADINACNLETYLVIKSRNPNLKVIAPDSQPTTGASGH